MGSRLGRLLWSVCARPLTGGRAAPPPRGGLGRIFVRASGAAVAGPRHRHILISIRLGPAPVWEGGGRRPHAGSGTTRRVLGAGRTVSEDGGGSVESGGEEGRVCSGRASRQGRGLRCGWRLVVSAALGLAGVSARRGRTGRRVARMRGTPVGRGRCAKGGVDLRARDSEPIVGTRGPGRGPRFRARRGFAGSRMGGVGGRSEP